MQKNGSSMDVKSPIADLDKVSFSPNDNKTAMHHAINELIVLDSEVSFVVVDGKESKKWVLLDP